MTYKQSTAREKLNHNGFHRNTLSYNLSGARSLRIACFDGVKRRTVLRYFNSVKPELRLGNR